MKKSLSLIAIGFAVSMTFAPLTHAADAPAKTAQQNKMTTCNKSAEGKKGDERKAFMKECLSAKDDTPTTQQGKMKVCAAEGKGKKGDEYKAFMKECLSKKA
ncbi:PsiF family protein [Polaromonas sp. YR568]|uniref:PsiF family protein n=1 Tax=Polaromonas sp. YR568 TaxID=1855301 RepID=UPI003137B3F1